MEPMGHNNSYAVVYRSLRLLGCLLGLYTTLTLRSLTLVGRIVFGNASDDGDSGKCLIFGAPEASTQKPVSSGHSLSCPVYTSRL